LLRLTPDSLSQETLITNFQKRPEQRRGSPNYQKLMSYIEKYYQTLLKKTKRLMPDIKK